MNSNPPSIENNTLAILAHDLKHEYTRRRRIAIERASEMLESNQYPGQVLNLLQTVAFSDENTSIRLLANELVEKYKDKFPIKSGLDQGPTVIEVCCPLGHVNHLDRQEICRNVGRYWRRSLIRDGLSLQEIVIACQTCGEEIIAEINCDGFD